MTELFENMEIKQVDLQMPKFRFESEFGLSDILAELGMQAAFDTQAADFSGIDGTKDLSISDVIHKAFVSVDEEGTEAAAATAVVFRVTSMPVTRYSDDNRPSLHFLDPGQAHRDDLVPGTGA